MCVTGNIVADHTTDFSFIAVFADVKEDMSFRRYLYRGKANALAESILLAMGRNINKLHCKIQIGRTGSYFFH